MFRVKGKNVGKIFGNEAGGHRWQRIPPTEKRGRRHTSTITIAVLPEPTKVEFSISEQDLEWHFTRGTGSGGQHKNKTDTAVQLKHLPTGMMVYADSRSQASNKELALATLKARLLQQAKNRASAERFEKRKQQVGSGMRGDKVRTICVHKNLVHDHTTNIKMPFKQYEKGYFDEFVE